jgi:hypothetical protein
VSILVDLVHLAQDRKVCWDPVKTRNNIFGLCKTEVTAWVAEKLSASEEWLCSVQLIKEFCNGEN